MSYLLDSHTLLWYLMEPGMLSNQSKIILQDASKEVYVSHASFWEITIKYALRKIDLQGISPEELPLRCHQYSIKMMAISEEDVTTFHKLPILHKDPFDRMLSWQAISRNIILISKDNGLKVYEKFGLRTIW